MRYHITVIAVGVFLAIVSAGLFNTAQSKIVEFIQCQQNRDKIEFLTNGKGTLEFSLLEGCSLVATGK